jgi:hypothetical protein
MVGYFFCQFPFPLFFLGGTLRRDQKIAGTLRSFNIKQVYNQYMPKRYFSKVLFDRRHHWHSYDQTPGAIFEKQVENIFSKLITIPIAIYRRFF